MVTAKDEDGEVSTDRTTAFLGIAVDMVRGLIGEKIDEYQLALDASGGDDAGADRCRGKLLTLEVIAELLGFEGLY